VREQSVGIYVRASTWPNDTQLNTVRTTDSKDGFCPLGWSDMTRSAKGLQQIEMLTSNCIN
jgi:hypothetical protein